MPDGSRDAPAGLIARATRPALLVGLILVGFVCVAWVTGDALGFEPRKDEQHYWRTTDLFAHGLAASLENLDRYGELTTPLCFLVWGAIEQATGAGIFAGRLSVLLAGLGLALAVAFAPGRRATPESAWALAGLVSFPYFVPLSVHLYTDVPAALFGVLGVALHLRGRRFWGAAACVAAIATRQYMLVVPAALAAAELFRGWREGRLVPRAAIAPALACTSLLGWIALFGGLVPEASIERWPTPQTDSSYLRPRFALYALATVGAYFVAVELVLFQRLDVLRRAFTPAGGLVFVALATLYALFPPMMTDHAGGPVGRVLRLALAPELRPVVLLGLGWLVVVRFRGTGLAAWVVGLHVAMMAKAWAPWDKYALPVVGILWLLKARRML